MTQQEFENLRPGDRVIFYEPFCGKPSGMPLKFDYPTDPQPGTVFCIDRDMVFVIFDWERNWFSQGRAGAAPSHPISPELLEKMI